MTADSPILGHPENFEPAKESFAKILAALSIKTVVFVDDEVGQKMTELDVRSIARKLSELHDQDSTTFWATYGGFLGPKLPPKFFERQVQELVRQGGEKLDSLAEQVGFAGNIQTVQSLLQRLCDTDGVKFLPLKPEEWEARQKVVIDGLQEDNRALILFDHQLHGDAGRTGLNYISALVKARGDDAVFYCGLITNTIRPDSEIASWTALAAEGGIEKEDFLPISKDRAQDPAWLVGALKKTTLNIYCHNMADIALDAIRKAVDDADEKIRGIDPYEFDHIFLKSSIDDGVDEALTFVRIFHILHRDSFSTRYWGEEGDAAKNFQRNVEAARALSAVADVVPSEWPQARFALRRQEIVEDGEALTKFQPPLENGDIFEDANGREYVLIGQPCDLAVRKDGTRANESHERMFPLVPMKCIPFANAQKKRAKIRRAANEMFLFGYSTDPSLVTEILFQRSKQIKLQVLDLAVFSQDGLCILPKTGLIPPEHFHAPWKARAVKLKEHFDKLARAHDDVHKALNNNVPKEVKRVLMGYCAPGPSWGSKEWYQGGSFDYKIKRVARLRPSVASQVLEAFGAYIARHAHDVDFSYSEDAEEQEG